MASNVPSENTGESAPARNGNARPMPKSAPPSGGATIVTVEKRACSAAAAVGSCSRATTERSAPISDRLKKTYIEPSRNATPAICAKLSACSAAAIAMLPTAHARTMSEVSIIALRGSRSTASPATKPKSAHGTMRAKPTTPAFAGEWVMARTRSGYAIAVDSEPIVERTCPDCRRRKSRFLRSRTGVTPRGRP